jgi:hypothetical protein
MLTIRNQREVPQALTSPGFRITLADKSLTSRGLRNTQVRQSLSIALPNPQAHYSQPVGGFINSQNWEYFFPGNLSPNTFTPDPTPKYSVSNIILNITPKIGDL